METSPTCTTRGMRSSRRPRGTLTCVRRHPRLRHGRDGLHPRTRRRSLAATRRRRRARGRGNRRPAEPHSLTRMRQKVASSAQGSWDPRLPARSRATAATSFLVEQFSRAQRGSSHGRSRIVRLAYPEVEFVELAKESFAGWRELEEEPGGAPRAERAARARRGLRAELAARARRPPEPSTSSRAGRRGHAGPSACRTAGPRSSSRKPGSSAPTRAPRVRRLRRPARASRRGRASTRSTSSTPRPSW